MSDRRFRIPIGLGLLAAIVAVVAFDRSRPYPIAGPVLAAALGVMALLEFLRLSGEWILKGVRVAAAGLGTALLAVALLPPTVSAGEAGDRAVALLPPIFFGLALALIGARWRSPVQPGDFGGIALAFSGIMMTTFPAALLAASMRLPNEGVLFTLVIVIGSKLNDIGGYVIGTTLGRHSLCAGISPKKTWEGAVGGLLFGTAGTVAIVLLSPLGAIIDPVKALLLGLLLGVVTQAGDIFESTFKRSMGVKDSAALIPAFGGILDLVDSLIFAAPLGYNLGRLWLE